MNRLTKDGKKILVNAVKLAQTMVQRKLDDADKDQVKKLRKEYRQTILDVINGAWKSNPAIRASNDLMCLGFRTEDLTAFMKSPEGKRLNPRWISATRKRMKRWEEDAGKVTFIP